MDCRVRVYYLVNLNQNYKREGWWSKGWDSYGTNYRNNIDKLKWEIRTLKITPNNQTKEYYQMKLSCKKSEESLLVSVLNRLKDANYIKLNV